MTKKNQDGGCCGSQGCGCDVKAGSAGECRCGETCRCSSCPCDAQAGLQKGTSLVALHGPSYIGDRSDGS